MCISVSTSRQFGIAEPAWKGVEVFADLGALTVCAAFSTFLHVDLREAKLRWLSPPETVSAIFLCLALVCVGVIVAFVVRVSLDPLKSEGAAFFGLEE